MQYDIKQGVIGLIFDLDGTLVDSMPLHFDGGRKPATGSELISIPLSSGFIPAVPDGQLLPQLIENSGLKGTVTVDQIMKVKLEEFYRTQHLIKPIEPVADIVRKYLVTAYGYRHRRS